MRFIEIYEHEDDYLIIQIMMMLNYQILRILRMKMIMSIMMMALTSMFLKIGYRYKLYTTGKFYFVQVYSRFLF
jgi:hypothetical protein